MVAYIIQAPIRPVAVRVDFLSAQEPGPNLCTWSTTDKLLWSLVVIITEPKIPASARTAVVVTLAVNSWTRVAAPPHHQGTNQRLKELLFPKACEQLRLRLHAQRDIQLQILVHSHSSYE